MKGRNAWLAIVIGVVISLLIYLSRSNPLEPIKSVPQDRQTSSGANVTASTPSATNALTPSTESPSIVRPALPQELDREQRIWAKGLLTPIDFYGKVVDEKLNPVEGASIQIAVNDKGFSGSTYETTSDPDGRFSLQGVHGLAVTVSVAKQGYHQLEKSRGIYGYAEGMSRDGPIPTANSPAIFRLQKAGPPAPLIVNSLKMTLPKGAVPVEFNMSSGKVSLQGQGDLMIELSIERRPVYHAYDPYDWSVRISVPNGGLLERDDKLNFVAPANGYRAVDQIDMLTATHRKWLPQVSKEYFLQLAGGNYARIEVQLVTGLSNFAVITSYLNPNSGDRNLEFDPALKDDGK